MIIQSEKDYKKIIGKFILQINSNEPDKTLMDFNWDFVFEKRLFLVINSYSILYLVDGYILKNESFESFQYWFNHYYEKKKDKRFHRLLTNKELDYLCEKLKEQNY